MHEIVLRRAALIDLEAIARYTIAQWGPEQAEAYLAAIRRDIGSLGSFPQRHSAHHGRNRNIHKMPSGHHLVFYRVEDRRVEIARILHERMDLPKEFDET